MLGKKNDLTMFLVCLIKHTQRKYHRWQTKMLIPAPAPPHTPAKKKAPQRCNR